MDPGYPGSGGSWPTEFEYKSLLLRPLVTQGGNSTHIFWFAFVGKLKINAFIDVALRSVFNGKGDDLWSDGLYLLDLVKTFLKGSIQNETNMIDTHDVTHINCLHN